MNEIAAVRDHDEVLNFGEFEFSSYRRRLFHRGRVVPIGSRATDLLRVLLHNAGEVVGNEVLIGAVWPDTHVDESNLRVQVSSLRRALATQAGSITYIENVPGRGYCFTGRVRRRAADS